MRTPRINEWAYIHRRYVYILPGMSLPFLPLCERVLQNAGMV